MYKVLVTLNVKMLEKSFVTINSTIYQNITLPTKIHEIHLTQQRTQALL